MSVSEVIEELDRIADDIARAGINGFGNQVRTVADNLRADLDASREEVRELLREAMMFIHYAAEGLHTHSIETERGQQREIVERIRNHLEGEEDET